jgi:hypothetical protein
MPVRVSSTISLRYFCDFRLTLFDDSRFDRMCRTCRLDGLVRIALAKMDENRVTGRECFVEREQHLLRRVRPGHDRELSPRRKILLINRRRNHGDSRSGWNVFRRSV